ncbi:MAG: FxsA family protein [Hydrocarboniphaga sp.]|uniref:FxsA family protein n=1 Tax=Hydrocarboniphaga sp. TaxID=2033016 RepID=UPI002624ADEF|nr:FxsA family protein [Hydrocarboniphaga sp.]MDB5971456.1 FxsA family protein [Hydrocarboniphaga sp.]
MPIVIVLLGWIALEAWLISRLTELVGGGWVLAWLLAAAVGGVMLIQRQGVRTISELQRATARGELPAPILLEGLVVLISGLLLILPGVISDVVALSLLLFGLRKRMAQRLGEGLAKARPDLKQPVTLEGEFRRTGDARSGIDKHR